MCNSLMCTITDWLIFIGMVWVGLMCLIAFTIVMWQLVKTLLEDFKE